MLASAAEAPPDYPARLGRAQLRIAEAGVDAALITSPANVRYLTGLVSSNAAVLLPADGLAVLGTDPRYAGTAERDCPHVELAIAHQAEAALARLAAARGCRLVAFEAQHMTVGRHAELSALPDCPRLVPLGPVVEQLRIVKDETEIALLARACDITCQALAGVLPAIAPGMSERELAILLERAMIDRGAEAVAFPTIVASGPNGAIPHHAPGARVLAAGDLVTIDCGAQYGGYHADMTRTVALGEPAGWQREIYELVAAAQVAGIAAAIPGADVEEVDATARDIIEAAGHGGHFQQALGHGVGLEVHEAPVIGYGRTGTLVRRAAITIEPGIHLPGKGGAGVEDTLIVRAGPAPAQTLTTVTRELLVL
jgi:Xaa-Pro aminopeptidase